MKTGSEDSVLITGASSGIGAALAAACAQRGVAHLFLCGRNAERLEAVAARCRALGVAVDAEPLDVTDERACRAWIERCDAESPLTLVFANAGVSTGVEAEAHTRRTFAVNVGGVLNTVFPALGCFRRRPAAPRRQIVITASIAGYHGLTSAPAYSASKAAVKAWAAGLRGALMIEGIRVNAVCPGFVRSRITDANTCPMPFFMEAEEAAEIILRRVDRNVGLIAFPWAMRLAAWLLSILPDRLSACIYGRLPAKME